MVAWSRIKGELIKRKIRESEKSTNLSPRHVLLSWASEVILKNTRNGVKQTLNTVQNQIYSPRNLKILRRVKKATLPQNQCSDYNYGKEVSCIKEKNVHYATVEVLLE
jgi:hypothetical protein